MTRLSVFFFLATSALAGPACVARHHANPDACVVACSSGWGWPDHLMGTDRWGPVMRFSDQSMSDLLASACGAANPPVNTTTPEATSGPAEAVPYSAFSAASPTSHTLSIIPVSISSSQATVSPSLSALPSSSPKSSSSSSFSTSAQPSFIEHPSSVAPKPSSPAPSPLQPTTSAAPKPSSTPVPAPQSKPAPAPTSSQAAPPPQSSPSSSSSGSSSGPVGQAINGVTASSAISSYLSFHNTIRAQHGAEPLAWNQTLANIAQGWADKCVFKHSGGTLGPFGENLAAGTGSSYGIGPAIQSWTNEVSQYNPASPVASHFTQVVWKATTSVGCAVQSCAGIFPSSFGNAQFFVCEYFIQGNVIGEFSQNVQV